MKAVRSRGWIIVINNYTDDDIAFCMSLYEEDYNCKYLILGFEKGSRKETPHIQGYVYYTNPVRESKMRSLHPFWHVEAQKAKSNVKGYCYCMDDDDYYEMGERPRQGHLTDLEVIKHDLKNGVPMKDISNNYFSRWCQYRRAFDEYLRLNREYETQLIHYEDWEISDIYKYNLVDCLVLKEFDNDTYPSRILHLYYSKKYRIIFYPAGMYRLHTELLEEISQPIV